MFSFFKKKPDVNQLDNVEVTFLETIVNNLLAKYPLFKQEFELKTFVGIGKNPGGSPGSFTYFINKDSWKKLCDTTLDNYDLKNIKFRSYAGDKANVDLYTSEGLIVGYKTNIPTKDIDIRTIDVNDIWEKHFLNNDFSEVEGFFGSLTKEQLRTLNIVKNTFRMNVNHKSYYPIHDLKDGDYLVIDEKGSVFKVTHDPFEVKKVFDTISELFEKGENG